MTNGSALLFTSLLYWNNLDESSFKEESVYLTHPSSLRCRCRGVGWGKSRRLEATSHMYSQQPGGNLCMLTSPSPLIQFRVQLMKRYSPHSGQGFWSLLTQLRKWGCRDGLAVKGTCICRVQFLASTQWPTSIYDSSFRDLTTSSDLQVHTYIHRKDTYLHTL